MKLNLMIMDNNSDIFNWTPKFDLILKKIEDENIEIFKEAMITHQEACDFALQNCSDKYKLSLIKVNDKLPASIKNLIETQ